MSVIILFTYTPHVESTVHHLVLPRLNQYLNHLRAVRSNGADKRREELFSVRLNVSRTAFETKALYQLLRFLFVVPSLTRN